MVIRGTKGGKWYWLLLEKENTGKSYQLLVMEL